jgi:hypothetical protein
MTHRACRIRGPQPQGVGLVEGSILRMAAGSHTVGYVVQRITHREMVRAVDRRPKWHSDTARVRWHACNTDGRRKHVQHRFQGLRCGGAVSCHCQEPNATDARPPVPAVPESSGCRCAIPAPLVFRVSRAGCCVPKTSLLHQCFFTIPVVGLCWLLLSAFQLFGWKRPPTFTGFESQRFCYRQGNININIKLQTHKKPRRSQQHPASASTAALKHST